MSDKIRFKALSIWVKIGIIISYIIGLLFVLSIIVGG